MVSLNEDATPDQDLSDRGEGFYQADPKIQALISAHGSPPVIADWNAVEVALYTPHPFSLQAQEAAALRFAAIRTSFNYHVQHNAFYRRYVEAAGVCPDDLRGPDDLAKIPLIPTHVFKGCPGPHEFISWLASLSSDEIAWPTASIASDAFEAQIAILNHDHGIQIDTTDGSNGAASFVPLDAITQRRSAHWKILTFFAMYPDILDLPDMASVSLWPPNFSWPSLIASHERVRTLLDEPLGLEELASIMTRPKPGGLLNRLLRRGRTKGGVALLERLIERFREVSASSMQGVLWAPAFLLNALVRFALERQVELGLGPNWRVMLGGGGNPGQNHSLSDAEVQTLAARTLGISLQRIYDVYQMPESLGLCALSCEGGYKHIPHSVLHPMVLNAEMEPLGQNESGRFAFLNPLSRAYPGFIITEDVVQLLGCCPFCDRTGPVLAPEISLLRDGEDRSCGHVVRQIISERLSS
jgi:long-chain-fatty-acid---luciferin-component ligase